MTDCPICHVKNEDDARFCAECGQRLSAQPRSQSTPAEAPVIRPVTPDQSAKPVQPRLNSPLLSGADENYDQPAAGDVGGVNRLRQMSSRAKEDGPVQPAIESPYKNPFDPRNDQSPQAPQQNQPAITATGNAPGPATVPGTPAPRARLRSPLLAGEEFDDEASDDQPQQQQSRSGSLRSPLLGGGPGGSSNYSSADRRQLPQAPNFEGQEKRKSGLRSPILSGSGDSNDYQYDDEYQDDEPLDEDNPNILRSPLLAARRPLPDRSTGAKTAPSDSNTQNAARGIQPSPAQQFAQAPQSPSSSYTSLRSLSTNPQTAPGSVPPAPSSVPPAPAQQIQPQPSPAVPNSAMRQGPITGPSPASMATSPAQGPQGWPQPGGPTSLRDPQSTTRDTPPVNPEIISAAPAASERYGSALPQTRSNAGQSSSDSPVSADVETRKIKGRSVMFNQHGESDDEDEPYIPGAPYSQPEASASPLPKLIAGFAGLLLLMKAYAMIGFFGSQWVQVQWLVIDQLVALATLICIIVVALRTK